MHADIIGSGGGSGGGRGGVGSGRVGSGGIGRGGGNHGNQANENGSNLKTREHDEEDVLVCRGKDSASSVGPFMSFLLFACSETDQILSDNPTTFFDIQWSAASITTFNSVLVQERPLIVFRASRPITAPKWPAERSIVAKGSAH